MATKAEIQKEIDEYQELIKDPSVPQDEKDFAKGEIEELKAKLEKAEEKPTEKPTEKAKPAKKEKPTKEAKPKKERKPITKKEKKTKATPTGKPSSEMPSCDELITKWRERREASKKSGKKAKTTPVFRKISSDVVDAVSKAIKTVSVEDIKSHPQKTIDKFESLKDAAEKFLAAFRSILGDEYKKVEAEKEFKELETMITNLEKKYIKK